MPAQVIQLLEDGISINAIARRFALSPSKVSIPRGRYSGLICAALCNEEQDECPGAIWA